MRTCGRSVYPNIFVLGALLCRPTAINAGNSCHCGQVSWWVEDETWELRAGDIFLTKPGEQHGAVNQTMHPSQLLWCQIADQRVGDDWCQLPCRSWQDNETISSHLNALLIECRDHRPGCKQAIDALLTLVKVAVHRSSQNQATPMKEPPALDAIRRHAASNPARWPRIDELIERAGCGRSQLFALAQEYWQCSPLVFVSRQRILHARQILIDHDDSITEIAFQLGYSSSQHFATAFKKENGLSPRDFRHEHMDS